MENPNHKLLKVANWLLAGILALLGFSACNDDEEQPDMYGTPHANFTIKGKVVNLVEHHGDNRSWFDTIPAVSTSSAGTFTYQFEEFPTDKLRIIATDIDGPQNGSYEKDSTDLALSDNDYKGRDGWYRGTVEKEINFNLKKKIKNE